MAAKKLQASRGTLDVLPPDGARRQKLLALATQIFARAGYEYAETPVFEETELFARGVGESTDIVQKEMFTFTDQGDRSLTLRPEGTAGVARAYVEHGMHKQPQPVKLWYWGSFFRQERPQAGRYRQFTQVGVEAIGSGEPTVDAELILLLWELLEAAGAGKGLHLKIGSLGTPETRTTYLEDLTAYLKSRSAELSDEVRARLHLNPLRAFDADHEGTRAVMAAAPRLLDRLTPEDKDHFEAVCALLDDAGIPYRVDPQLVRGLDYYTRTLFELESDRLGAQSALGGGGRYDGLVEELGGQPTPGVGWAAGIERIMLVAEGLDVEPGDRVYVALATQDAARAAFGVVRRLRAEGYRVEMELAGRSLKGQLKQANRIGAGHTVIAGDGYDVRDMDSGEQVTAKTVEEVVALVSGATGGSAA